MRESKEQPSISLIMPTFNRKTEVMRCVARALVAVERCDGAQFIVVDNGSTDGTWEWLQQQKHENLRLLQLPHATISELRNAGAAAGGSDLLCFVDSDCLVSEEHLSSVVDVFATSGADMVGAMYGLPEDAHWIESTWMRLNCPEREGLTNLLPGGSMSVRKCAFNKIGGFDRRQVTGEDADLCGRLRASGGKIFESPKLRVTHLRNMNSLSGFFRKQVWHSVGRLPGSRDAGMDHVSIIGYVHCLLSVFAVAFLILGGIAIWQRVAVALLLALGLPVLAVAYRVVFRGGEFIPIRSTLLYTLYFYARGWAAIKVRLSR